MQKVISGVKSRKNTDDADNTDFHIILYRYINIFSLYFDIIADISIFAKKEMYSEIYEKSGSNIIRELGERYSDYRKQLSFRCVCSLRSSNNENLVSS